MRREFNDDTHSRSSNRGLFFNPVSTLLDEVFEGGQIGVIRAVFNLVREQLRGTKLNLRIAENVRGINTVAAIVSSA